MGQTYQWVVTDSAPPGMCRTSHISSFLCVFFLFKPLLTFEFFCTLLSFPTVFRHYCETCSPASPLSLLGIWEFGEGGSASMTSSIFGICPLAINKAVA